MLEYLSEKQKVMLGELSAMKGTRAIRRLILVKGHNLLALLDIIQNFYIVTYLVTSSLFFPLMYHSF